MDKLFVTYGTFKIVRENISPIYWYYFGSESDGYGYKLYCAVDPDVYITEITNINDIVDFEQNYKITANQVVSEDDGLALAYHTIIQPLKTPDGRPRVATEKSNTTTVTFYSFDWTDKTTWYPFSTFVSLETLTNPSNDGYAFQCAHKYIIDTYHGMITGEDYLKDNSGNSYRIKVWVDGALKTERDPHYGSGGDYLVSYADGYINFFNQISPSSVVTSSYHYAGSSMFIIVPSAGKQIRLACVEVQFSDDVIITDSVIFQPYGFVEAFAPQYCTTNGGPYPPGTKIPLGQPLVYKSIQDYLNDSKKSYPAYAPIGGSGWRGLQRPAITMDWDYEGEKVLRSDQGMEIRVFLQHDNAFGGTFATATFYCRSENLT